MPPTPHPLLDDARWALVEEVQRFACEQLDDPELYARDEAGEFWHDGWRRCSQLGLCGLPAPEPLGGRGADRVTTAAALEALGYGCTDAGLVFSLNAHLWSAVVPLWHFGNDEQRQRYLPPLCRGEWIGLHAMTEPESGSDAFALSTIASRDGAGYVLRGRKTLITNAPNARLFIVFARSPGSEGALGVTPFLVEANAPGVTVGAPIEKLGLRTSPMAEIALDDVRVGSNAVLGREGRGARVFWASMEWERLLIMAGQLGALQRMLEEVVEQVRSRPDDAATTRLDTDAETLADVQVSLAAVRALMYETARRYDRGGLGPAPAAAVKLLAAETILRGTLDLLDLGSDRAWTPKIALERRLRDAAGGPLYSGTSQMMRRIVAKEMGL